MNRRTLLEWLCRGLGVSVAALIGLPGVKYFAGSLQSTGDSQGSFQRLKRLQDLPVGRPVLAPIMGSKQDAWTRSDQQVVGRVWLVRQADDATSASGEKVHVKAFTSVCPHMGCQILANDSKQGFVCPCHRANFSLTGSRQVDPKSGEQNHAPRDMDLLECRIAQDADSGENWVEVKFEKFETGRAHQNSRA